jgi:hypothetical protein
MGSLSILDVIISAVLAGFILLTVANSNARMNETLFTKGNDLVVQENLVNLVRIIEKDFRRMGYCDDQSKIPDPASAVVAADRHSIAFLTDINSDGSVDTLRYEVGSTSALGSTPNPRDMLLFRYVKGTVPRGVSVGLTRFDFKYYDANGDSLPLPIADLKAINSVELALVLESTRPYDTTYSYTAWKQLRLETRNLHNR